MMPIPIGLVVLGFLLAGAKKSPKAVPSSTKPTTTPGTSPTKLPATAMVVDLTWREMDMPRAWRNWGVWVARGESRWKINAHNRSPGERAAATKAYERLVSEGRWPCDEYKPEYVDGSGGWYGQLAPFTVFFLKRTGIAGPTQYCRPATVWRNPIASTSAHIEQVRGTLNGLIAKLDGERPNFLQLRAAYGLPSRNPYEVDTPKRRTAYTATLKAAGLDPSLLDETVPILPPANIVALEGTTAA